jgi:hypothetical protein
LIPVQERSSASDKEQSSSSSHPRKFSKYDPSKHGHSVDYYYETRNGETGNAVANVDVPSVRSYRYFLLY